MSEYDVGQMCITKIERLASGLHGGIGVTGIEKRDFECMAYYLMIVIAKMIWLIKPGDHRTAVPALLVYIHQHLQSLFAIPRIEDWLSFPSAVNQHLRHTGIFSFVPLIHHQMYVRVVVVHENSNML